MVSLLCPAIYACFNENAAPISLPAQAALGNILKIAAALTRFLSFFARARRSRARWEFGLGGGNGRAATFSRRVCAAGLSTTCVFSGFSGSTACVLSGFSDWIFRPEVSVFFPWRMGSPKPGVARHRELGGRPWHRGRDRAAQVAASHTIRVFSCARQEPVIRWRRAWPGAGALRVAADRQRDRANKGLFDGIGYFEDTAEPGRMVETFLVEIMDGAFVPARNASPTPTAWCRMPWTVSTKTASPKSLTSSPPNPGTRLWAPGLSTHPNVLNDRV